MPYGPYGIGLCLNDFLLYYYFTYQLGRLEHRIRHRASCDFPLANSGSHSNNTGRTIFLVEAKVPTTSAA